MRTVKPDAVTIKERPILFTGAMVRAILDGRKTQTRRIVKPQPPFGCSYEINGKFSHALCFQTEYGTKTAEAVWVPPAATSIDHRLACPHGQPGDRLWVKENAWIWCEKSPNGKTKTGRNKFKYIPLRSATVIYRLEHPEKPKIDIVSPDTGNQWWWRMKVGRFMPRWASRITLEITKVRVERLQDISEEDAKAEGCAPYPNASKCKGWTKEHALRCAYMVLWNSINEETFPWESNPWVWVIEFKRIKP